MDIVLPIIGFIAPSLIVIGYIVWMTIKEGRTKRGGK